MRKDSQKAFIKQRRKWLKDQVKARNKETSESCATTLGGPTMIKKLVSKDTKEIGEAIEATTTNFEEVWKFVEGSKEFKAGKEAFSHIFPRIIGYYFVNTDGGMFLMGPDAVSNFFEEE